MKQHYSKLVAACAAALLASCGTQIQMTEAIPAKVNIGRGTTLVVNAPYRDYGLKSAFQEKIMADGYYKLPGYSADGPVAMLNIEDVETGRVNGLPYLSADARVATQYQTLYKKGYMSAPYQDSQGVLRYDRASRNIAHNVMNDLTPHEKSIYVRVNGSKENPDVEKGALACRAGNWELGETHAKQALKVNPQDPEALFLMGIIERNKMHYARSTQYFKQADALKPSAKYKSAISKNAVMERNDKYVQQQLAS